MPEGRELLAFIKRVRYVPIGVSGKAVLSQDSKKRLLSMLQRDVAKVLVLGAVSVGSSEENETRRPFVTEVARQVGKLLGLDPRKPICMTTTGGGIDFHVCSGFSMSLASEATSGRLWLYPNAREKTFYEGLGRPVEIRGLPDFEGIDGIDMDTRSRFLVSRMAASADSIIAIRGGRGVEYACIIGLAQGKRLVLTPCLGGMGEKLFYQYRYVPNVTAPSLCLRTPSKWSANVLEAEAMAKEIVHLSLGDF